MRGAEKVTDFIRKLSSRKFLLAVVGVVVGVAMSFGVESGEIMGAVTTIASIIAYINGEAKVDAAAVSKHE